MADVTLTEGPSRGAGVTFTQDNRLLAVDTPLGKDKLLLTRLAGEDEISTLFSFRLTMLSADHEIAPESLIGSKVTVWIRNYRAGEVPICGIVRRFSAGSIDVRGLRDYHAEIVPWLWFLTQTTDCRIFQHLSVPKIIETIFSEHGFTDYEKKLIGNYKPLDFCVQYRESAFAFISRWMEELGIFYYFRHEADRHVMVLGDDSSAFRPVVEKNAAVSSESGGEITSWRHSYEFQPGRYAHKDFAFKTPSQDLQTRESSVLKLQRADALEIYDYPGGYARKDDGQALSRLRMEEIEAAYHTVAGTGTCASFFAGGKFTVARHPLKSEENKDYVLRRIAHQASDDSGVSLDAPSPSYENRFETFPAATRFRSPSRTCWPVVKGPQTATVVGPAGETIHTDKHGRVKLQFHWDRRGKSNDQSSCWVRVSQNWAGKEWGGTFIPHVGQEVVVSFLEGDPDMPLVTGRVYNAERMHPRDLPVHKTQSLIQDDAGNYVLMEAKGGAEDVRLNAVKDMNHTVHHDYNETVKTGKRTVTVNTGPLIVMVEQNTAQYGSQKTTTIESGAADVHITAATQIALDVGESHLLMQNDGTITIKGLTITIEAGGPLNVKGALVKIN